MLLDCLTSRRLSFAYRYHVARNVGVSAILEPPATNLRDRKPRNARTARILKAREPQLTEGRKKTLLLHGTKCQLPLHNVLKTFHTLLKPHSILLTKKNENIHPFENVDSLEFLASKNDTGLVVFGSSSKKRPNTITILRMFNSKLLEMVELMLVPTAEEMQTKKLPVGIGMKPMILFAGAIWDDASATEQASIYAMIKSLFLDMFSGEETNTIDVEGLQYLIMIAAGEPKDDQNPPIHIRWYKIKTRKSGQKLPRVEVEEVGPKLDFRVGRVRHAESGTMREAMKSGKNPHEEFNSKQKNVGMDAIGDKIGKVHLGRQDLNGLQTRKMKGLKRGAATPPSSNEDLDKEVDVSDSLHGNFKKQRFT